jgi:C1q domain/Head domain of trimeric autotransporter adhesin
MKQFICLLVIFLSAYAHAQNVGVGTTTPHPSAALDVSSSNKGFLPPRMSSSQRTAIASPKKGLMVYDTTQNEHVYFDGGKWRPFYAQNYDSAVVDYSSSASASVNLPTFIGSISSVPGNSGFIYDNGGAAGNYLPNSNSRASIAFDDSTLQIKIEVEQMNAETFYDSLFIVQSGSNGADTIATLTGNQLGSFVATNSVSIIFKSNNINHFAGFKIRWGRVRRNAANVFTAPLFGWHIDNKKVAAMGGIPRNNNWHTDSVGYGSLSYGIDARAKGTNAVALGNKNIASGSSSLATGFATSATALTSTAMGQETNANGIASTALGYNTTANGLASSALGYNTTTKGYASTTVGMYNDSLLTTNQNAVTATTPLFVVGNGTSTTRSNAMVVYKNGNTDLNGNVKINNGINEWTLSAPVGFEASNQILLSVQPGAPTTVVFDTQIADDGGDNYNPTTGEFTVPVAGMYYFDFWVFWSWTITGSEAIYFYVNGNVKRFHKIVSNTPSSHTFSFNSTFKLNVGDVVKVVLIHQNTTYVNVNNSHFVGVKLY